MALIKVKETKELGWDFIKVTSNAFSGAVKEYEGEKGKLAIIFTPTHAYIIKDASGAYFVEDYTGLINDKDFNVNVPQDIEGTTIIAMYEDQEVLFSEVKLTELGVNTLEIKQDMTKKLLYLGQFQEVEKMA